MNNEHDTLKDKLMEYYRQSEYYDESKICMLFSLETDAVFMYSRSSLDEVFEFTKQNLLEMYDMDEEDLYEEDLDFDVIIIPGIELPNRIISAVYVLAEIPVVMRVYH